MNSRRLRKRIPLTLSIPTCGLAKLRMRTSSPCRLRRVVALSCKRPRHSRVATTRDIFGGTELQVERHGHVVFQQVLDLIFVYLEPSSAPSLCPVQKLRHAVGGVLFHRTRGADSLSDACESSQTSSRREGIGLRTFPPFCTPWPKKLITSLIMTRTFSLLAGPPHACSTASRSAVQLQAERYGANYIPYPRALPFPAGACMPSPDGSIGVVSSCTQVEV